MTETKLPTLTKEELQMIAQALSVIQVQVKDAPRIIELLNKVAHIAQNMKSD